MIKKHMGVASHLPSRWYRKKSWSCWLGHHDSYICFFGRFFRDRNLQRVWSSSGVGMGLYSSKTLRQAWGQMLEVYESCRILSKHLYGMLFLQNDSSHVLQWFHGMWNMLHDGYPPSFTVPKTPAPPKTNTGPLEKEIPFGKHHFQVPAVVFQGCIISYPKLCFRNSNLQNLQNGLGNPIPLSTCAAKILCPGSNLIRE